MKFLTGIRNIALLIVSFQLIFSPVAMAAKAEKRSNLIWAKSFIKASGLSNKKMTVREYYRKIYPYLTKEMVEKYQFFAFIDQDQLMPIVDTVTFTDARGVEQVRLNLTFNKKTYSLQTEGLPEELKVKFNGMILGEADLKDPVGLFGKIGKEMGEPAGKTPRWLNEGPLKLSKKDWDNWSPLRRAQFLTMTRYLADDLDKVFNSVETKGAMIEPQNAMDKFALVFEILLPEACARTPKPGEDCLAGAWITTYGVNASCGAKTNSRDLENQIQKKWKEVKSSTYKHAEDCSAGSLPCNPTTYGFDLSGGKAKPFCVSGKRETIRHMTKECNSQSQLRKGGPEEINDVKRILESHVIAMTGKKEDLKISNQEGKRKIEHKNAESYKLVQEHLNGLTSLFSSAMAMCDAQKSDPSESYKISKPSPLHKYNKGDQGEACSELSTRYFALGGYVNNPDLLETREIVSHPPIVGIDLTAQQTVQAVNGQAPATATVPPMTPISGIVKDKPIGEDPAVAVGEASKEGGGFCSDRNGNFTCKGPLIAIGLGVLGFLAIKSINKKKPVTNPTYAPNPSPGTINPPVTGPTPSNPTPLPPPAPTVTTKPSEGGSGVITPPAASGSVRKISPPTTKTGSK